MRPIRKMILFAASIMILVHATTLVQAQECPDYQDFLEWVPGATLPDRPTDVAVSGDHAYATVQGLGLQVILMVDPLSPVVVGTVDTLPTANSVAVAGDLAYVLTWDAGLHIFDVSSPDAPSLMGSVVLPSWSWEVVVSGSYAYVGAESGAFTVIDVSDPTSAEVVGTLATFGPAQGVAVAGNFVYVTNDMSGFQVIDVSDPTNPYIAGSLGIPGSPRKVAVSGGFAYVSATSNGLKIIDISNPATPQLTGSVETPIPAWDVAVSGNYAYLACGESDPVSFTGSLEIINITEAAAPFVEGFLESVNPLSCVTLAGDFAITNPGLYDEALGQIVGNLATAWIGCELVSAVRTVPEMGSIPVLHQNAPNPFNPQTTIAFDLPTQTAVSLHVYNVSGRLVDVVFDAEVFPPGQNEIVWQGRDMDGRQVASGTYFYRLNSGNYSETYRMVLLK